MDAPRLRIGAKDVVIALALLGAGGYGAWVALAARGGLGASWTDGARVYPELDGVRYAVWDDAEELAGTANSSAPEGRSALAPDGRFLVFAVGERGLGADLYMADLVDGSALDARPLDGLNSAFDELAPAFAPDALYFATDRAGAERGLDLWRAPYADGVFGAPEPVSGSVNTAADETDPLPLPGARELLFASNRARGLQRDFDLYAAVRAGDGESPVVSHLSRLSSPFDEREPGCTSDGRLLVFASDRAGSRGAFDLYRSVKKDGDWLPPAPLDGLNTPGSERGPLPSPDGFSLTFSRTPDAAPLADADLYRARSRELFLLPPRAVTLADVLALCALLLLALLALLAKRRHAMEVIYRCFLVSLLVHLFFLWYTRHVHPEGSVLSAPEGESEGGDRLFRVRLEHSGPLASLDDRERGGALAASRSEDGAETLPGRGELAFERSSVAPAGRGLDRAAHEEALPGRNGSAPTPAAPHAGGIVQLADGEAPFERKDGAAPALALGSGQGGATPEPSGGGAEPARAAVGAGAPGPAAAGFQTLALGEREADALPAPAVVAAEPTRRAEPGGGGAPGGALELERPRETFGLKAGGAPGLALPAVAGVAAPARDAAGPERALGTQPTAVSSSTGTDPLPRDAGPLASAAPPALAAGGMPARRSLTDLDGAGGPGGGAGGLGGPGGAGTGRAEPAVALHDAEAGDPRARAASAAPPARFDATADLVEASARRSPALAAAGDARPERLRFEPAAVAPERAPTVPALAAAAPPAAPVDDLPARLEHTPYRNRFGAEKAEALSLYGGGAETEAAVAQGLRYLASIQDSKGYWGSPDDFHDKYRHVLIGKTGLGLLAFLGAGHTQASGTEYSGVARKAIDLLVSVQDQASGHFGNCSAYGHGIATYALAECFAITRDEALRAPLERAVRHIVEEQKHSPDPRLHGGWGYYFPDGSVWSGDSWPRVSVTAWQVMALESARLGGLTVADAVFDDARLFLARAWDAERGAFRYDHDPSRLGSEYPILPASTPAAIFALSLLGVDPAGDQLAEARRFVLERAPHGYVRPTDDAFVYQAEGNDYFWYYGTLAMFRAGGSSWGRWNAALKDTLLGAQEEDGSWEPISIYSEYAGDDDEDRSYTTAMCVLSLEIYYRYFTPLLEVR